MNDHSQIIPRERMEKESMLILKSKLSTLLKEHGVTATKLGKDCGIAKQVICDWLAGVQPRSLCKVKRVALYFGLSLDELCFGESIKTLSQEKKASSNQAAKDNLIVCGIYELVLKKISKPKTF